MNLISTLKTLPLIGILAIGLALSPMTAVADKGDRSYSKSHKSHNGALRGSHHKKHVLHNSSRYGHKYKDHNRRYNKHHNKPVYRNHYARGHGHHPRHYYPRNHYNNYYAYDRGDHNVFDNVEFMFGLHTGNFDIIFRD